MAPHNITPGLDFLSVQRGTAYRSEAAMKPDFSGLQRGLKFLRKRVMQISIRNFLSYHGHCSANSRRTLASISVTGQSSQRLDTAACCAKGTRMIGQYPETLRSFS
jgi:hypothetical protein